MANFLVTNSKKKVYLSKGSTQIALTITKIDPTKPFFDKIEDVVIDMKVIERNQTGQMTSVNTDLHTHVLFTPSVNQGIPSVDSDNNDSDNVWGQDEDNKQPQSFD